MVLHVNPDNMVKFMRFEFASVQPLPSPTGLVHHRPAPPRADKQLRIYLQVRKLLAARYLRNVRQVVVYEGVTSLLFISQQVQVTRASARRHTTNVTPPPPPPPPTAFCLHTHKFCTRLLPSSCEVSVVTLHFHPVQETIYFIL